MTQRFFDLNTDLRNRFGERVQKITVDAGLTCPNRDGTLSTRGCTYCNPKGSGSGAFAEGLSITRQLQDSRDYIARRYKAEKFLVYFQSFSNTYAPLPVLKSMYDEALTAITGVVGLSIGTRPDCVDEAVLGLLEEYARDYLIWLEYGLQSVHDQTLGRINRGHDFACFERAVTLTQGRGIQICAHVILGLPGEGRSHVLETAQKVADLSIHGVKIHLLYVVKGTPLEREYRAGRYRPLEQTEYAEWVCDFLELLPPEMVIQRITGDPHPEELAAPSWSLDKNGTRNLILDILKKRDSWQGKRYREPPDAGENRV